MPTTNRGALLITPRRAPEMLFGLGPIEVADDTARGRMRTAEWMTDAGGRPAAGMLGVLVDDVVGQATLTARPDGCWPVTTELSVDVLDDLPTDGSTLEATSELLAGGARSAVARGEVRGSSGRLLAVATVATVYVRGVPEIGDVHEHRTPSVRHLHDAFAGDLRVRSNGRTQLRVPPGPFVENATGRGHGGVVAALTDVVAAAAVADNERPPLRTSGLRITYLRPLVLDGPLTFTATVLHRGRRTSSTQVEVTGHDGRLCAAASVTGTAGL